MVSFGMCFPDDNDLSRSHLKWASFMSIRPLVRPKVSAVLLDSTWDCRAGNHCEATVFPFGVDAMTAFYPTKQVQAFILLIGLHPRLGFFSANNRQRRNRGVSSYQQHLHCIAFLAFDIRIAFFFFFITANIWGYGVRFKIGGT
jgi:hypothetical protein